MDVWLSVLRNVFEWRQSFDERAQRETQFLLAMAPLLSNPVAESRLHSVERRVLEEKDRCQLRQSLVVVVTLAKLYESPDGVDGGAAGGVLGFKPNYLPKDAYNALADLRQLELSGGMRGVSDSFALLTGDRSLALLWCGINVQSAAPGGNGITLSVKPVMDLFPRLARDRSQELIRTALS